MNHVANRVVTALLVMLFVMSVNASAQNVYELRQLTDQQWRSMSTQERLEALNTTNNHAQDQTLIGDFGIDQHLYQSWGSDYYEMQHEYENYAFRGFENYNILNNRRNRWYYSDFGDRMTRMSSNNQKIWSETINDDGTWDDGGTVGPTGFINRMGSISATGVWVARESTDDWMVSAIGSGALRKKLSPLTFSIPNYDGMAIDFQSANYQASFISSAFLGIGASMQGVQGSGFQRENTVMVRGGQLRRKFGALTLGMNYANMYQIQPNRDEGHGLKGTVADFAPTPVLYLLRVMDDSPWDEGGPLVHNVSIIVNGRERPDIIPTVIMDSLEREKLTAIFKAGSEDYNEPNAKATFGGDKVFADRLSVFERVPKYADYLYFDDLVNGRNQKFVSSILNPDKAYEYYKMVDTTSGPVQVNGNDYVVYIFDLSSLSSEDLTRVQAKVTVENDYKIQCSELYLDNTSGRADTAGETYFQNYQPSYWKTLAQADGNIKDGSNLRTVTVDFAYEVGNTIYGFNASFNYLGFRIDGEYVVNTHYYQFSDGSVTAGASNIGTSDITPREGKYSTLSDNAYYLTLQKEWSKFSIGGELFKMGKFYRPNMLVYQPKGGAQINAKMNYVDMTMVADNDDDDQYPDVMFASQGMAYQFAAVNDPDGVFPGLDNDKDGIPDTDKNLNNVADYAEPFLMLDIDPDEFIFGDDFNNNMIPDFREDDLNYDLPYDLDRKGYHLTMSYKPIDNVTMRIGTFKTHGVGVDNRTFNDYFKSTFNYNVLNIGTFYAEYHLERIKDNIADPYHLPDLKLSINTSWGQGSRYKTEFYYDELEYRNSLVNRLNVHTEMRPISSVTLESHLRFENNNQVEGTMYDNFYQSDNKINTIALSNKIVYTKALGNFTFSPGVKVRLYKKDYEVFDSPRDHYLLTIPIIYLRYQVSDNTRVTFGVQGFKGLEMTYKDYVLSRNNYKQRNALLQIENLTNYLGFQVWGAAGFQYEQIDFDETYRKFEEFKSTTLFMRIWVGN